VPDPQPAPATVGRLHLAYRAVRSPSRLRTAVDFVALAVVAFVPMLASQPGVVSDDTKTYLYLDPGRYVRAATSLWTPSVGLGTVTHENIGYLLPMGPFYWAMAELHVPLWVAQRLWMGCLLYAAGAGALFLCRTIGLWGPGRYVAALAFMFTPYVLQYAGRISVILMPWAGLPWMIAFVVLALRRGGWRYPALFALVVALVSGVNASSVIYVGIAPLLWLPYAVVVAGEATWRRAWGVAWKTGLLCALVSLWWAVGLQIEAAYGVNVLKYTETVPATSSASLASEILRGLGYWYFYGADRVGPWTQSMVAYTQHIALILLSFLVPALCVLAAVFSRWRHRSFFVLITVVGMVLAVGPNPYTNPSGFGSLVKSFMVDTTAGLALRSTDRASPLVILGLAVLLGAGVTAASAWRRPLGVAAAALATAAVAAAAVPLWTGDVVASGFTQPASPPAYVQQAATTLDHTHVSTRVLALPGNDFAADRWGDTIDTAYPGLMTRPFVTHEQQIMGSLATADVLHAVDTPIQDGTMDWNALAPMASLMDAGDVLVQYDQAYERYDTPDPQQLALDLSPTPPGLSSPVSYGTPQPNVSLIPHLDEAALGRPPNQGWTAPLVSYTVADPRPVVRSESASDPLVVDGDATGIVNAADVGLLSGNPTILYAGTLDTHPSLRTATLGAPAQLVVTDTNRKQGYRWNTLSENTGYTETAAQGPDTADPTDAPLNLFPTAGANAQTTAVLPGLRSVTASTYGSSITYLPEDRPSAALDGNVNSAWLTDPTTRQVGQWWQATLSAPKTLGSLVLVQPLNGVFDRTMASVRITFDGGRPVTAKLGPASLTAAGQVVTFSPRSVRTLRITVTGVHTTGPPPPLGSGSSVGFAEVGIPGVTVHEVESMPTDLLQSAGSASLGDRLSLVMTRLRSSGTPPRADVEPALDRTFWLPTARAFSLIGTARISPLIPDDAIDRLVGRPGSNYDGLVAYSNGRLPGDLRAGAIATLDGDPTTVWEPGFGATHQAGDWLQYTLKRPIAFNHLDLKVVADGQHSVPTRITVSTDSGSQTVNLPSMADASVPGSVVDVPASFPALFGQSIRITVDQVRIENTPNYYSRSPIAMPIGIAEVGIPGLTAAPIPATMPSSCRNDLLAVDGHPVWAQVSGSTAAALDRQALNVSLCGPDAAGLLLGPGSHTLESTVGQTSGFDIDQLALDSAPGGAPQPPAGPDALAPPPAAPGPHVGVTGQSSTTIHVTLSGLHASTPAFDLVLGQSINSGWTATVGGRSLGPPVLVDGFANGWRVDPATLAGALHQGTASVVLTWTPQTRVDIALFVSLAAVLLCLALVFVPRRRRAAGVPRGRPAHAVTGAVDAEIGAGVGAEVDSTLSVDNRPRLAVPFTTTGPRVRWWVALIAAVAVGGVGTAIAAPATGLAAGAATGIVLLVPRLRALLGLAAVAGVVAAGVYTAAHQAAVHAPVNGSWPLYFGTASQLAWVGVVFLGADAVVDVLMRRRGDRRPPVLLPEPGEAGVPDASPDPSGNDPDAAPPDGLSPPTPPLPEPAPAPAGRR
jgi:arabinofuranan 3-O-arabinosyltransferase